MFALATLLALAGCTTNGSYSGTLTDGITGKPVAGARLLAKAPTSLDMTCQVFETTTTDDGSFSFAKVCGDTEYTLQAPDETLFLGDMEPFDGGLVQADIAVKAYRAPGSGVNVLIDDTLTRVPTSADIGRKNLMDSEEQVIYPATIPAKVFSIPAGQHLVISGAGSIKKQKFHALVEDKNKRRFGTRKEWTTLDPWWYVGIKFNSDTDYEKVEVHLDESKVTDVTAGENSFRYIDGAALPPGRYAMFGDHDRRMYVLDFGE